MGWKRRGNGLYYYRSLRLDDRVITEYVGRPGPLTQAWELLTRDAAALRAERAALRRELLAPPSHETELDEIVAEGRRLAAAALVAAGFHCYRGQWRRRRATMSAPALESKQAQSIRAAQPPYRPMRRAIDRWCEAQVVAKVAGENEENRAGVRDEVRRYAADLAGHDPSPIEQTLAESAALCWLYLRWCEAEAVPERGCSLAQADFRQRSLDRSHRRYLAALKTLASVRRIGRPGFQLNIAAQQVVSNGSGARSA